jgi:hypothetical protein
MNKPPQRPAAMSVPNRPKPGGGRPGSAVPGMGSSSPKPPSPEESAPSGPTGVRPVWYKRKYLVYPRFQMTLILLNSAVTVVLFGFTALLVVRSHLFLENLVKQTRLPAQNLFTQLLTQQLRNLLIYMSLAVLVAVFITGISTLLLSHKLAGPMIKLRNYFNSITKNGDFPEDLHFREGDFFQDLPPTINQAFTALKKKWFK